MSQNLLYPSVGHKLNQGYFEMTAYDEQSSVATGTEFHMQMDGFNVDEGRGGLNLQIANDIFLQRWGLRFSGVASGPGFGTLTLSVQKNAATAFSVATNVTGAGGPESPAPQSGRIIGGGVNISWPPSATVGIRVTLTDLFGFAFGPWADCVVRVTLGFYRR